MKSLKYILLLLLIFVIGFSIYIAVQPNAYKVTRSKTINAPQAVVYNNIIDFKNWKAWSSWVEEKPETVITLSKKTKGVDGFYTWKDEDGVGSMKTISTQPNTSIQQEMQFGDFPKSDVSWQLKPAENGKTEVTWTIKGEDLPFQFKIFSALMGGMEKQIGPHFNRGLVKLDSVLQAEMKVYRINVQGVTQHSGGYYIYKTASCKLNEFEKNMKMMLPKVGAYAMTHNITMAGPPFILYHKWDEDNDAAIFSTCVPTTSKISTDQSDILTGQLKPFKAVKSLLIGHYDNLKEAWETSMTYCSENNLEIIENGPMLETYLTDPMTELNPANWVTEIYVAIK